VGDAPVPPVEVLNVPEWGLRSRPGWTIPANRIMFHPRLPRPRPAARMSERQLVFSSDGVPTVGAWTTTNTFSPRPAVLDQLRLPIKRTQYSVNGPRLFFHLEEGLVRLG
jgi:hypothetical protein